MNVGVFYADTFEYKNTKLAALHDIGKAAIPELIKLARPFNRDQRLKMQMHTTYDARIIETMMPHSEKEDPRIVMARYIALHHHQTFKGKGSPRLKLKKLSDMHLSISDHQQSWEYEDGPWKGPRPSLLVAADFYRTAGMEFDVRFYLIERLTFNT